MIPGMTGHRDEISRPEPLTQLLGRWVILFICLVILFSNSCAGGSLLNPQPLIGRDRLVFQVTEQGGTVYYTRNIWFNGENYRFRDVYGRDKTLPRENTQIQLISQYDYYKTPI